MGEPGDRTAIGDVETLDGIRAEKYLQCVSPNPNGIYVGHADCCPACHVCFIHRDDICTEAGVPEDATEGGWPLCLRAQGHQGAHVTRKSRVPALGTGAPVVPSS